jgi:hypothetical protein
VNCHPLNHYLPGVLVLVVVFDAACGNEGSAPATAHYVSEQENVAFSQSSETIERYDLVEVTINVVKPVARNPFTGVTVSGRFGLVGKGEDLSVDGFCDSDDGSVFRIHFMPCTAGDYTYSITYRRGDVERIHNGAFHAFQGKRRGIVRVDSNHPWHFIWEGSGEHYFLNGTTAFLLMGWENEQVIHDCIDRLHSLEVNRMRVLLDGRTDHFWTEPIRPGNRFHAHLNPWVAKRPDNVRNPGFDYARFNCPHWEKFERMLKYARERDMIVSVIFGWNDTPIHPAAGSEDERRYFRYAVARLAAFSNVTWDLGDDLDSFRSEAWTHDTGTMLYGLDTYHHLATSHPAQSNDHQDRTSSWFGMTSFQRWERPLHQWMLAQRQRQAVTGRIIPQVNEEYGYEDHYPSWAPYKAPVASAEADRRAAWQISMAGCYQTTGETAKRGTGIAPDSGGGWVNGRGDDTMTMLKGYAHMVRFFTSFAWWETEPHDELVNRGYCLAAPGRLYVVYLSHGGAVTVKLDLGLYAAQWFNPRSGEYTDIATAEGPSWTSPVAPDEKDWALLLRRTELT